MIIEVKTYRVKCDRCNKSTIITRGEYDHNLPKGWGHADVHDCGLTGYTRTDDLCPKCLAKSKKRSG